MTKIPTTPEEDEESERCIDNCLILESYSNFLEENGYLDSDWRDEIPTAIDRFNAIKKGNKMTKPTTPEMEKWIEEFVKLTDTTVVKCLGREFVFVYYQEIIDFVRNLISKAEARGAERERSRIEGVIRNMPVYLTDKRFNSDDAPEYIHTIGENELLSAIATPTQEREEK